MAFVGDRSWLIFSITFLTSLVLVNAVDIFLEWQVNIDTTIKPISVDQPVL